VSHLGLPGTREEMECWRVCWDDLPLVLRLLWLWLGCCDVALVAIEREFDGPVGAVGFDVEETCEVWGADELAAVDNAVVEDLSVWRSALEMQQGNLRRMICS
jgi:hypothetical protein